MANEEITRERALYFGNLIGLILYGFQLMMYFQSVTFFLAKETIQPKIQRFFVVYGAVLLVFLTMLVVTNVLFGEEAWIEHRVEMDPAVFIAENIAVWWYNTLGLTAGIAMNFMGDGLLLYRCHIIWGSRLRIMAFPFFMYFASIAMAVIYLVDNALPGHNPFARTYSLFAIAWISLSVALNVILTTLISVRLLMMRSLVRSILPARVGAKYTSIVSIFVESALPLSLLGIGLIVTYFVGSPVQLAVSFNWGVLCATSPQLIIFRVAMGSGWSKDIVSEVTQAVGSGFLFATHTSSDAADAQPGPLTF